MKPACSVIVFVLLVQGAAGAAEPRYAFIAAERIEYRIDTDRPVWNLQGWYGGDRHKFWWKLEGDAGDDDANEVQLLYSRAVSPYFDLQLGGRFRDEAGAEDAALVIGVQGLAPFGIETDAAIFLSDDGNTGLRAEFERDFYVTQRIALQPRVEVLLYEGGRAETEAGIRLRYALTRRFAPYLGFAWSQDNDADESETSVLAGVRFWF